MATGDDIATQRAIDGEAQQIEREMLRLVGDVSTLFVGDEVFSTIQRRVNALNNDGLRSINSTIHAIAVEFAEMEANKGLTGKAKFTKADIIKLVNDSKNTGAKIKDGLNVSRQNNVGRISNEMARLNSLGYDTSEIRRAIVGTKSNKYQDGFMNATINSQNMMSRTYNKMSVEVADDANRVKNPEVIGYIWNSILDGRTSSTCQTLNGKTFYYDKSGAKPLPPAHPNCRSTTEPILDDGTKRGDVPEVESVNDWAKNNPKQAEQAMGKTRYQLFTDGNLKIDRYTDAQFQPLTLKQLAKQNEIAFQKALKAEARELRKINDDGVSSRFLLDALDDKK